MCFCSLGYHITTTLVLNADMNKNQRMRARAIDLVPLFWRRLVVHMGNRIEPEVPNIETYMVCAGLLVFTEN